MGFDERLDEIYLYNTFSIDDNYEERGISDWEKFKQIIKEAVCDERGCEPKQIQGMIGHLTGGQWIEHPGGGMVDGPCIHCGRGI